MPDNAGPRGTAPSTTPAAFPLFPFQPLPQPEWNRATGSFTEHPRVGGGGGWAKALEHKPPKLKS